METKHIYVDRQFQNKAELSNVKSLKNQLLDALQINMGDIERAYKPFTKQEKLTIARAVITEATLTKNL